MQIKHSSNNLPKIMTKTRGLISNCALILIIISLFVCHRLTIAQDEILSDDNDNGNESNNDNEVTYKVPNPFKNFPPNSHYTIKGVKTLISRHKTRKQFDVEEYFSINVGVSFSQHSQRGLRHGKADEWIVITDGQWGRSYIVSNIDKESDQGLECEMDHVHGHRHVFPWLYEYDLGLTNRKQIGGAAIKVDKVDLSKYDGIPAGDSRVETDEKRVIRRGRRKNRRQNAGNKKFKSAIYGLGGIWLNAIEQNVLSKQVDHLSPFALSNVWSFGHQELNVQLLFDKLDDGSHDGLSEQQYQGKLDASKLGSIKVDRSGSLIDHAHDNLGGFVTADFESEYTIVDKTELIDRDDPKLARLYGMLDFCRHSTNGHRLFPSLMNNLAHSMQHLFHLTYIARLYPLWSDGKHSGEFDKSRHRNVYPITLQTEVFSLTKETELQMYRGIVNNDNQQQVLSDRMDAYLKRFTERSNGARSSRHSTVHYHIIGNHETGEEICKVSEGEPLPKSLLFVRPIHFHSKNGALLSGHLTGLGALLMNAADFHYKSFNLQRKTITVASNPHDLNELREVQVNEWQIVDKKSGWVVHFYFDRSNPSGYQMSFRAKARGDVSRLVRVDIRNPSGLDSGDSIIIDSSENEKNDYDLLARYDVVDFGFEISSEIDVEMLLTPGPTCHGGEPDDEYESQSSDDEDSYSDTYGQFEFDTSDDSSIDEDEVNSGDNEKDSEINQEEGEQMEEGQLSEDYAIPDLFELIEGRSAYNIKSMIYLNYELQDKNKDEAQFFFLEEIVDLEQEIAVLKIYLADRGFSHEPQEMYYINYASELMFKISADKRCSYIKNPHELNEWLRLFSKTYTYFVAPKADHQHPEAHLLDNEVLVESSSIPLFGIGALWQNAIDLEQTRFMGARKSSKNDKDHKRLVWVDESYWMKVMFNFLLNQNRNLNNQDTNNDEDNYKEQKIRLDSIEFENFFEQDFETSFDPIKVKIISIKSLERLSYSMPYECFYADSSATHLNEETKLDVKPPDFFNFFKQTGVYYASYSVSHTNIDYSDAKSIKHIMEEFDLNKKRGRFKFGTNEYSIEIYIEAEKRKMLAYSRQSNRCKELDHLKTLVDLKPTLDSENDNFDFDKMYGLAALWISLSKKKATLRVLHTLNNSGHREELHIFTFRLEINGANGGHDSTKKPLIQEVLLMFKKGQPKYESGQSNDDDEPSWFTGKVKNRNEDILMLDTVQVQPLMKDGLPFEAMDNEKIYRTNIFVHEIVPVEFGEQSVWELPDACKSYVSSDFVDHHGDGNNSNEDDSNANLPKLTDLLARMNYLHVKSEITWKDKDNKQFYLIADEWLHDKMVRMRRRGVGKASELDLDYILYSDTAEVFDLSQPFNCKSSFPIREQPQTQEMHINTMDFWVNKQAIVDHPSQLFYGLLAMWLLAEKNSANIKKANSLDMVPLPHNDFDPMIMEQELAADLWLVDSPATSEFKWYYTLKFVKRSAMRDNQLIEWHTLESIDIVRDIDTIIHIELVNLVYHAEFEQMPRVFRLPLGWGCSRDQSGESANKHQFDQFEFVPYSEGLMSMIYEAQLDLIDSIEDYDTEHDELIDGSAKGKASAGNYNDDFLGENLDLNKKSSPYVIGRQWRGGHVGNSLEVDIKSELIRTYYANGTIEAKRIVTDEKNSVAYKIDQTNGACESVKDQFIKCDLYIEFPFQIDENEQQLEKVCFPHDGLNQFLVGKNTGLKYLQNFTTSDGRDWVFYEGFYQDFYLSRQLHGPASIVRQFNDNSAKVHRSMKISIYLYDVQRVKLKAILRLVLFREPKLNLARLLKKTNVFDCYLNDGASELPRKSAASYAIDYRLDGGNKDLASYLHSPIVNDFYRMLIENTGLLPLQLDGKALVKFNQDQDFIRIHFNVLDAPPVYMHFKTKVGFSMSRNLESIADLKLVSSLDECSNFCLEINCVAMTYCLNHQCNVVNEQAIRHNLGEQLAWAGGLSSYIEIDLTANECTYYHKTKWDTVVTLMEFERRISQIVDSNRNENKMAFKLVTGQTVQPLAFNPMKNQLSWHNLDADDVSGGSLNADQQKQSFKDDMAYSTLLIGHSLDLTYLDQINAKSGVRFELIIVEVERFDECLEACVKNGCLLMSSCRPKSLTCTLLKPTNVSPSFELLTGAPSIDIKDIKLLISSSKPDKNCNIMMRDYRMRYDKLNNINVPQNYSVKLDGYSSMECALACQIAGDKCLSFDQCSSMDMKDYSGDDDERKVQLCFLQMVHTSIETVGVQLIDMSAYGMAGVQPEYEGKRVECNHYSKSLLQDYILIQNRRLERRLDTVVRGLSADKCAFECQQDDDCKAFEYCRNDRHEPVKSCRYIRIGSGVIDLDDVTSDEQLDYQKDFGMRLKRSKHCSIYVSKLFNQEERLNHSLQSISLLNIIDRSKKLLNKSSTILVVLGYLIGAICVGTLLQMAYIRLTGRVIPVGFAAFD